MSTLVNDTSGFIAWTAGDKERTIEVPFNWDNLAFSDDVEVAVRLVGLRSAVADRYESVVATIHGTPEGFCPPGYPPSTYKPADCGDRHSERKHDEIDVSVFGYRG